MVDYKAELKIFCETQLKKDVESVPLNVAKLLEKPNRIKAILYQDCDQILLDKELQQQIGYSILPNGGWYVAMKSLMPNVTKEMVDWWFWWHAQDPIRYKMWFPNTHKCNAYDTKYETY